MSTEWTEEDADASRRRSARRAAEEDGDAMGEREGFDHAGELPTFRRAPFRSAPVTSAPFGVAPFRIAQPSSVPFPSALPHRTCPAPLESAGSSQYARTEGRAQTFDEPKPENERDVILPYRGVQGEDVEEPQAGRTEDDVRRSASHPRRRGQEQRSAEEVAAEFRANVLKINSMEGLTETQKQEQIQELQRAKIKSALSAKRRSSARHAFENERRAFLGLRQHQQTCGNACDGHGTTNPCFVGSENPVGSSSVAPKEGFSSAVTKDHGSNIESSNAGVSPVQYATVFDGSFPGRSGRRCVHYPRKCWLKAACCGKYYPCRRCHDENEDHEIQRRDTREVGCLVCGAEDQPADAKCRNCGVRFALWYCSICRFYDDTRDKDIYHCADCGLCRVGKGVKGEARDNYHCPKCNTCVPLDVAETHPCMERSLDSDCPGCREFMATSTEQVVFLRCGHAMHQSCFKTYAKNSYTCPVCFKSLADMSSYIKELDIRLAADILPPAWANRKTRILCNDCEHKTEVKFHFKYHKCGNSDCGGYNTKVLSYPSESPVSQEQTDIQAREYEAHYVAQRALNMRGATPRMPISQSEEKRDASVKPEFSGKDTEAEGPPKEHGGERELVGSSSCLGKDSRVPEGEPEVTREVRERHQLGVLASDEDDRND